MDRVLLSAGRKNIEACIELAAEHRLGIEVMNFAIPDVLDGDWQAEVTHYQQLLADIPLVTLHGPFLDMSPGSPDRQVEALVMRRYQHAIQIAGALHATTIIFHANFIAALKNDEYRTGWHARNVQFWGRLAEDAAARQVTIAIENMWEFDPYIITDMVQTVDHPNVRICLDVGHAHLFSGVPFETWLEVVQPYLVHTHLNNNDGILDHHRAFPDGVLDYHILLTRLRSLPNAPSMTLEMDTPADMHRSLPYFGIGIQADPMTLIGALDDVLSDEPSDSGVIQLHDLSGMDDMIGSALDSALNEEAARETTQEARSEGVRRMPRKYVTDEFLASSFTADDLLAANLRGESRYRDNTPPTTPSKHDTSELPPVVIGAE